MFNRIKSAHYAGKIYRSLRDDYHLSHTEAATMVNLECVQYLIQMGYSTKDSPHAIATMVLAEVLKQVRAAQAAPAGEYEDA